MKNLNNYIVEAWSGVKKQSLKAEIKAWCEEMGVKNYTINSKGEIDVNGDVWLMGKDIKELPYKFGYISNTFSLNRCKNLTSLKNCPDYIGDSFDIDGCTKLDSLKGCPKEVEGNFHCGRCKRKFTKEEVQRHCNIKNKIYL